MGESVEQYFKALEPGSYAGASTFRKQHKEYKSNDLAKLLSGYRSYTLHKPVRHNFQRNRIVSSGLNGLWEFDLCDYSKYAKSNDGNSFLFSAIDAFSKTAWVIPIKSKSALHVTEAFEKLMGMTNRRPKYIRSDKGGEYLNKRLQKAFKSYNIRFYTSKNDDIKCSIIERFLRTLKTKLQKYMVHNRTERYIDVLDNIVASYNQTIHRTIGMKPDDVTKKNEAEIWRRLYRDGSIQRCDKFKFNIGDHVRIVMRRRPFQKGYEGQWSEELFKIAEKIPRNPVVYRITDLNGSLLDGTFYEQELQKVQNLDNVFIIEKVIKTRRRNGKTQYFVKWLGYDESFNSWCDEIL